MELNLHPIAIKSFVSGHEFQEHERVVSYLVRESSGEVVRRDLLATEDQPAFARGDFGAAAPGGEIKPPAFVYCRWIVGYKPRKDDNSAQMLKLTAENLFLTIAIPAGSLSSAEDPGSQLSAINTPLLQFLALMMERKKLIKARGLTEDGQRHLYEHMASHQMYEVPVGDLNVEFFQKIQEHLGVLVGSKPQKSAANPVAAVSVAAEVRNEA